MDKQSIEIGTVKVIRYFTPTEEGQTTGFYVGDFKVEKIMNTNMLKITALEESKHGVKTDIKKGTVIYFSEDYIVQMQ